MSELHYISLLDINNFQKTSIEQKNAIKIALMMVRGFRDILDELNYNEEKLRALQFNLDDNYEAVDEVFKTISDVETKKMLDELLTNMAKLEMEISDRILEHTHAS